ncbi:MAG: PAS domain S-box protein, partial [Methanomassiliicoccales archaeon]
MVVKVALYVTCPILILAVDDEPDLCALTKEFLERTGYIEVDIFGSVAEARKAIARRHYDAIVSDYQMPGEDGIQFLKSLRASGDTTPFILFTGKGREEIVIEAINNGADAYLQKGWEPRSLFAELEHRMGTIVRRHRAEAALLDSESEFRTLFEDNPDGVLLVGIDGKLLNCNQAAARMVLMRKEEIVGYNISDTGVFSSDDLALFQRTMIAKAKGEPVSPIVSQLHRKDGTIRWVEIRSSVVMKAGRFHAFQIIGRDITERKNAEEAVKESEQRLSDIIDFLPDATVAIDTGGHVIAWNKAIEEMTGVPALDMIGKGNYEYSIPFYGERRPTLIDLVSVPDEGLTQHKYSNIKKEGDILLAETSIPRPLGRYSVLMGKASILYDRKGTVIGAIESIRDITESRHTEDALRVEQEKYVKTFLAVPDVVMVSEIDTGTILEINDAAFRVFGYTREELIGNSALDLGIWVRPEDRADLITQLQEQGRVQDNKEQWRRKSGEVFSAEISADTITLGGKKILISVIHDITERVKAEETLRESERRYRILVDGANEAIVVLQDGMLRFVNPATVALTGISEQELISSPFITFIHPEDRAMVAEHYQKRSRGEPIPDRYVFRLLIKEMTTRWVELNAVAIDWEGRPATLNFLTDITERKRADEQLARANRELRMLSDTNQALIRITDEATLMNQVCRIVVEVGGYRLAWIGFAEQDEAKTVRPVAHSGLDSGYIESANITWADSERGRGPGGAAIRTGQVSIARNISKDPDFVPWKKDAVLRGYQSVIALPLTR